MADLVNKHQALQAFFAERDGAGSAAAPVEEGPGALMATLDIINRPYSAIMGGVYGVASPDATPLEGFLDGLTGKQQFGVYDTAVALGADPESRATRYGSLALDVANPLDPLNWVGGGFTKAGKFAKGLKHGSKSLGKITSRAQAASKGAWSPITFMGQGIVPKALAVPAAKAADKVGAAVSRSAFVQTMGRYFGGTRKFEKKFPGVFRQIKMLDRARKGSEEDFVNEMLGIQKGLLDQGLKQGEVDGVMRQVTSLLESPEDKIFRMGREIELIDGALEGRWVNWKPGDELDPAALQAFEEASLLGQKRVDKKVGELRSQLANSELGAAAPNSELRIVNSELDAGAIASEDHILERYLGASGGAVEKRVLLADLRKGLSAEGRAAQDASLLRMQQEGKLVLYRMDDPQELTAADKAAALFLSEDAPRHLVYLKQDALDAAVNRELRIKNSEFGTAAPNSELRIVNSEGDATQALRDELHVLESVQVSKVAKDMPPEMTEVMLKRRSQLNHEIGRVRDVWDEATEDALDTFGLVKPLLDDTKQIYDDILGGYDKSFDFPVQDYLKHMFPAHWSKLPSSVKKAKAVAEKKAQALAVELAAKGYDEASIQMAVRKALGDEAGLAGMAVDRGDLLKGDLDAFRMREVDMTIDEVVALSKEGRLPWSFEDHSAVIASAMHRDAQRWKFGHDVHAWIGKQDGWTKSGEDYAKLGKAGQKDWVPVEFHMPWIKGDKDPFKGTYMHRDVKALMESQMRGNGMLTNDEGLNGVLQSLHGIRRWWSAWTLAPFPSTRTRDFASDIILSYQGGLNPVADMAKAVTGESAYAASMAMQLRRKGLPTDQGAWKQGADNLDNLTAMLSKQFGEEIDSDRLLEWMEIEGILGANQVRDLDLGNVLSKDPLMQQAMKNRPKIERAKDWLPFQAVGRSKIIHAGFAVSEQIADYTRTALFFDTLRKAAPEAKTFEDALDLATGNVRKHLFDYSDLTTFEREIMRLVMPFYTFSAKNIPLQVEHMLTDAGRSAWVGRLYESAWGQFDDSDVAPEDLPEWLRDGMGLPMMRVEQEGGGAHTYAIWSPRGWLPITELNEMADLIRGKAGTQILSRLNPLLKEGFEQALNVDAYTMRQIDDGTVRDVLGFVFEDLGTPVSKAADALGANGRLSDLEGKGIPESAARRMVHVINNFRLVTEVDRLDPGGVWTKIGKSMGWWEDERPHRWSAPGPDRAARFLFGMNMKGIDPIKQAERNWRSAHLEANKARGRARSAERRGNHVESKQLMDSALAKGLEAQQYQRRLGELRKRVALGLAQREE